MPYSLLHTAADRHRLVAKTLTDPKDRAVINKFADEVDDLSRFEITVSDQAIGSCSDATRNLVKAMLAKFSPPEPTPLFEDLLQALDHFVAVAAVNT